MVLCLDLSYTCECRANASPCLPCALGAPSRSEGRLGRTVFYFAQARGFWARRSASRRAD
eukprot:9095292-Pyramimonas_sp.AAC.1